MCQVSMLPQQIQYTMILTALLILNTDKFCHTPLAWITTLMLWLDTASCNLSLTCGVNSSSNSPVRYCRSNSAFSPTYDAITRFKRCCFRSSPKPKSSTPALLLITVNSLMPVFKMAAIRFSGIPHNPNPIYKWNIRKEIYSRYNKKQLNMSFFPTCLAICHLKEHRNIQN